MAFSNGVNISIKRGDFSKIDFSVANDGELVYARDIEKLYIKNGSVANLVNNVVFGLLADRPQPQAIDQGLFYFATDANVLYASDGSTWYQVNTTPQVSKIRNETVNLITETPWSSYTARGAFIVASTSNSVYANIALPSNFSSFVNLSFVYIAKDNRSDISFNTTVNAAGVGQPYNDQSAQVTLHSGSVTKNAVYEQDLSSLFSTFTLGPNYYIGAKVDPNHKVYAMMFKCQYLVT